MHLKYLLDSALNRQGIMRFVDVLQIMGIRIADDMAVFQIGMLLFQFMILGHIFDLGTGELAVRRNEADWPADCWPFCQYGPVS